MTILRNVLESVLSAPLSLPTAAARAVDEYNISGNHPLVYADFAGVRNNGVERYRVGASDVFFDTLFTYSGLSNRTMFNSSGYLVWAPHNFVATPTTPATQSVTVISGVDYVAKIRGTGSVALTNAATGTVTDGSSVEFTAASTTLTMTVTGSPEAMWLVRNDLDMATVPVDLRGGVDDNSFFDSGGSAGFAPRRNSYDYISGTITNVGLTFETDAGTNLIVSNPADWNGSVTNLTVTEDAEDSKSGRTDAISLITTDTAAGSSHLIRHSLTKSAASADYIFAIDVKDSAHPSVGFGFATIYIHGASTSNRAEADIELATGTVQSRTSGSGFTVHDAGSIALGGGWRRLWLNFESNADTNLGFQLYVAEGHNDRAIDGDGVNGILVQFADIKEGNVLSSFVPNTGTSTTRAAETIEVNASQITAMPTALTHYQRGRLNYEDSGSTTQARMLLWQEDSDNFQSMLINTDGALTGRYDFDNEEATNNDQSEVTSGQLTPGLSVAYAMTASASSSRMMTYLNGTAGNEDVGIAALPDLAAEDIRLCDFQFVGNVAEHALYGVDLSNSDQEALT